MDKQESAEHKPKILLDRADIRSILDGHKAIQADGPLNVLMNGRSGQISAVLKKLKAEPEHLRERIISIGLYAIEHKVRDSEISKALQIAQGLDLPKDRVKKAVLNGIFDDYIPIVLADEAIVQFNTNYLNEENGITDVDLDIFMLKKRPRSLDFLERK
jgi:hypothetical protein